MTIFFKLTFLKIRIIKIFFFSQKKFEFTTLVICYPIKIINECKHAELL